MKPRYLYIIMCIFSLLALAGCRDEEAVQSSEGKRTVTVNLGIAMSRAEDDKSVGDGSTPTDMKVWIFNEETLIDYYEIATPTFSGSDALGELVNTHEHIFELDNTIQELQFYAVLNSANGTELTLGEGSTVSDITDATFTGLQNVEGDNQVPIYGTATLDVSDQKKSYSVTIETTRAVSKLELFFTKESESSYLKINNIKLEHVPDKGYLAAMPDPAPTDIYTGEIENILENETEEILTSSSEQLGDFSNDEGNFTKLALNQTYLLENPNGGTWTGTANDGNQDYTYTNPYDPEIEDESRYEDGETRYKMTVNYQTSANGESKDQVIYLPAMERNIWNKIFVRVKDYGKLVIQYKALPWQLVESQIGYAPQPASTENNPFDTNDEYTKFLENGYILLPVSEFKNDGKKGTTVKELFSYLYNNPNEGDDDARYCILTKPTYVDDEHKILKTGSAGARYFFMLTGPEGATWEARLSNEKDFYFSHSKVSAFEDNTDGYDEDVLMVSHGIARQKPYVIQINVRHSWTGVNEAAATDENGNAEGDYPWYNDDIDIDNIDKWKEDDRTDFYTKNEDKGYNLKAYFNYLTAWGKEQDNLKELVETKFFIVVKLADGSEYRLTINPAYSTLNKNTLYQDNRRYAGENDFVWIRQVPAQYDWSYEKLAEDGDTYWWKENPYWRN